MKLADYLKHKLPAQKPKPTPKRHAPAVPPKPVPLSPPKRQNDPYRLEFELPGLPPMANSGARSNAWQARYKRAREWRRASCEVASLFRPRQPLSHARLTLVRCSSVEPDDDGLAIGFKAVRDGLVDAGVISNDRRENVGRPDYQWERAEPGQGKVRVIVEEMPPRGVGSSRPEAPGSRA